MDCDGFRSRLDGYLDGELAEDEVRALVEHAHSCAVCGRELRAAELAKEAMAEMDRDLRVPLEAQAAWRDAVRAEAQRMRRRRWSRTICAAAAALVLLVGVQTALTRDVEPAQPLSLAASDGAELIARDGGTGTAAPDGEAEEVYAAWKKISAQDAQAAMETLQNLAAEYSGSCAQEGEDAVRIEIPAVYLEDFINAASRLGTELDSETGAATGDTAVVYIQIQQE